MGKSWNYAVIVETQFIVIKFGCFINFQYLCIKLINIPWDIPQISTENLN